MANRDNGSRDGERKTRSDIPVEAVYGPREGEATDYAERLGAPGQYPFTRGIYPTMYRGRVWTMRQYSGFGTAEESNARYRNLLASGATGLSVAFDLPTQIGLDSDHPLAQDEVGRVGVSIDTLRDFELLFRDIPLDQISTSFTINAVAAIVLAMYVAVGEEQGVAPDQLRGTIQNDILKEFAARGTWIFPTAPSLRLIADTVEYCARHIPKFNAISIAGAHYRDAGASAIQEAAYTMADGLAYIDEVLKRGIPIDDFAPNLSFFFYTYTDIFEEVAKYRAMRRLWATYMRERYGAQNDKSCQMKIGVVCGGSTLTLAQPEVNVVRVAYQALAAALGGVQSMFTCAWDEAYAIPTEESTRLALRTQQVLAHESGVVNTVDPLAGSYYIEQLTDTYEAAIRSEIERIEARGGMARCIEAGLIQQEIATEAYRQKRGEESGERIVVGVNQYTMPEPPKDMSLHGLDETSVRTQLERLNAVRAERDGAAVTAALARLRADAEGTANLMPTLLDAVKAYATVGEMVTTLKGVFGEYREPATTF